MGDSHPESSELSSARAYYCWLGGRVPRVSAVATRKRPEYPHSMIKSGLVRRVGAALFLAACSKSAPPAAAPPPPEVRIVVVAAQPIANTIELPGRLQAIRTSEVRARVDGIVQRRLYTEGTDVRAGQPLFAIDPRPLRAQVSAAAGRARPRRGDRRQRRSRTSRATRGSSRSRRSASRSTTPPSRACARRRPTSRSAAPQLAAARLNLSYTTVTAPIAGRAGRAEVTEGALVSGAQAHAAHAHRAARSDLRELLAVELRPSSTCAGSSRRAPRRAGIDQRRRCTWCSRTARRTAASGTSTSST